MKKILFFILLIIISIFLYGKYVEVNNFKIHEYTLSNKFIPDSFKELKIIHFSDLLYRSDYKEKLNKLVKEINKLQPDIIVFSGDLFNNEVTYSNSDLEMLKKALKEMNASLYKYAVVGDNDEKFIDNYKDILYESDFNLLDNKSTLLFYKDVTPINIVGLTDTSNIEELLTSDVDYNYTIAITHKPDNLVKISEYNINTVLSGHSLGGIINVPYYGGIIKKDGAKTYINDHYKLNDTNIYISNGLGYEKNNFRLFNTPSINVYRFEK